MRLLLPLVKNLKLCYWPRSKVQRKIVWLHTMSGRLFKASSDLGSLHSSHRKPTEGIEVGHTFASVAIVNTMIRKHPSFAVFVQEIHICSTKYQNTGQSMHQLSYCSSGQYHVDLALKYSMWEFFLFFYL